MDSQSFEQAKEYAFHRLENELTAGLFYHSLAHTLEDVLPSVERLARMEGVDGDALLLLRTAACFHDLGFIEMRAGHEAAGARIMSDVLPGFGYNDEQIKTVRGIIKATKVPQSPQTLLEQIMADADLDVLGRDDFMNRNENLRRELAFFGQKFSDAEWFSGQLEFLESHTYFTASARALRNAGQAKNVMKLKRKLEEIGRADR